MTTDSIKTIRYHHKISGCALFLAPNFLPKKHKQLQTQHPCLFVGHCAETMRNHIAKTGLSST